MSDAIGTRCPACKGESSAREDALGRCWCTLCWYRWPAALWKQAELPRVRMIEHNGWKVPVLVGRWDGVIREPDGPQPDIAPCPKCGGHVSRHRETPNLAEWLQCMACGWSPHPELAEIDARIVKTAHMEGPAVNLDDYVFDVPDDTFAATVRKPIAEVEAEYGVDLSPKPDITIEKP